MNKPPIRDSAPDAGPTSSAGALDATVLVEVGEATAAQVSLAGADGPLAMALHAVKGSDLELVGPTFFPKNCELTFELADAGSSGTPGDGGGTAARGVVRKVQMLTAEPTYAVWVRLEQCEPALLQRLVDACRSAREPIQARAPERVPLAGSLPDWALRLVGDGELSEARLEEIARVAVNEGVGLDQALVDAGLVLEERVASLIALESSVPFVDPHAYDIQLSNCVLVPEDLARRHGLFPLFDVDGVITLGMKDPSNLAVIDQVRLRANCQVDQCLAVSSALDPLIERAYNSAGTEASISRATRQREAATEESSAEGSNAIVRLVRSLIEDSARDGVSDVHIEPERDKLRVRIRVDGILHERSVHPLQQHAPIVSRIKVMSKLDIAETRRPQDGHFGMKSAYGNVDVRVSTIPTVCGENVVLRLLVSDGRTIGLEELGMPPDTLATVEEFLEHPNGMILVTGPTGSGKTSTLYACLARLSTIERNVVTVEDPVERRMPLLRQTEVNPKAGLTFAAGLRSILRQDPDVIMVGEIRDKETAEISVQAALTGHLVLSTLHTNTAAGAIVRLSEIGIPPFLITSSLRAVMSQRLVRRVCAACIAPTDPDPRLVAGLGMRDADETMFVAGSGCARCHQTGYKGRVGLYEMLQLTPALSSALLSGASRDKIEAEAERALTSDMRSDGLRKVREGATTLEEVARIIGLGHSDGSSGDED